MLNIKEIDTDNLNYLYGKEKLYDIIKYLATAQGDMRKRLNEISVEIDLLSIDNFPDSLKTKWLLVEKKLYKHPPTYNYKNELNMSSIEHSLNRMQNRTACKIAEIIFELWEEL